MSVKTKLQDKSKRVITQKLIFTLHFLSFFTPQNYIQIPNKRKETFTYTKVINITMLNQSIYTAAQAVKQMDIHMRQVFLTKNGHSQEKKLWENTFIKHQIDKRNSNYTFSLNDHIRAMVYSLLSSSVVWDRIENQIDLETGKILSVDEIFHQYDVDYLMTCDPDKLRDEIKELHCASFSTLKQMTALINVNIKKLLDIEKQYGNIDTYYQMFIDKDNSMKTLIKQLSNPTSKDKFVQMSEALNAEYLKNVGYDIAKPDRHIKRILGSKILGCSEHEEALTYESFDIVADIASVLNESKAKVDYILWSYCANKFGEICTKETPKCEKCVVKEICNKYR